MTASFWRGRSVFITGHTGFKGGWLSLWLTELGAKVSGFSLPAPTTPSFFEVTKLASRLAASTIGDIRDAGTLAQALQNAEPEIVFHLAAQPLVRASYALPVDTYATNVMGTVHLLEAVRSTPSVKAVVLVTSDKCYENREWVWPYRENEPLGGFDPYSSSKACAEIVASAWRRSFLEHRDVALATARAGNVIGGGDWAADRLLPDFLRALDSGRPLIVRSPDAIRPWQHVLEPLSGYLLLAQRLYEQGAEFAEAWNFGPGDNDVRPVRWVVEYLCARLPGACWQIDETTQPHEARTLKLDSHKARVRLNWRPRWGIERALEATLNWHQAWKAGADMAAYSLGQIADYGAEGCS
jgi:CDP-glucose 4,6-dehydratase